MTDRGAPDSGDPGRVDRVSGAHYADHYFLEHEDQCWFLGEYRCSSRRPSRRTPDAMADAAAVGDLIRQLKWQWRSPATPCSTAAGDITPARDPTPPQAAPRQLAQHNLAQRLRAALDRDWVEAATWVPAPSPRYLPGGCKDRLSQLLRLAFAEYDLDLRAALRLRGDGVADHWRRRRVPLLDLYGRMQVDAALLKAAPLRRCIVLFDDVLTSGKHYRCARRRLLEVCGNQRICGMFLARRVPHPEPGRLAI